MIKNNPNLFLDAINSILNSNSMTQLRNKMSKMPGSSSHASVEVSSDEQEQNKLFDKINTPFVVVQSNKGHYAIKNNDLIYIFQLLNKILLSKYQNS